MQGFFSINSHFTACSKQFLSSNITKEEEKALLEIAKRLMAAVDSRGDLEARDNDSEDFIEVPVWGIQKAMEEAYLLGRMTR